jgi:uncharacterized protein
VRRRKFLQVAGAVALLPAVGRPLLLAAVPRGAAEPGAGSPYGELLQPDEHGLMLPRGFRAREIARAGQVVAGTQYVWHTSPDGGATFARPDGGWIYVSNSEVDDRRGGVGAVRFGPDGNIIDAYSICTDTSSNCAGGATSWGTWLSCEEIDGGQVYECDPDGDRPARVRPALGRFSHEAVACDPVDRKLYLTEDDPNGRLYRFTPARWESLDAGVLEAARTDAAGAVVWIPTTADDATTYGGGEGIAYHDGRVIFTTKSDQRIRAYDTRTRLMRVLYEPGQVPEVAGPDNVTVARDGDVYVCEDTPTAQDLIMFAPDGPHTEVLRLDDGHEGSELAGVAFGPSGDRLYVSSQRGAGGEGVTYEITGPFRSRDASVARGRPDDTGGARPDGGDDDFPVPAVGVAGGAAVVGLGALAWLRHRRGITPA